MPLLESIQTLASQNQLLIYLIIYVATILFGNIAVFAVFIFALRGHLGPAGFLLFILTVFTADITSDLLWYWLGSALRDTRLGNFIKNHIPHHKKIEEHLQENSRRWIFAAKFLQSTNFPVVFLVGWSKINFKKFFNTALLAVLSWFVVALSFFYGFTSGLISLGLGDFFKRFELIIVSGILIFVVFRVTAKYFVKVLSGNNPKR